MKIVYYTSGVTGSGRLVTGIAIRNALLRKGIPFEFIILHSSPRAEILSGMAHHRLPMESMDATDSAHFRSSAVFSKIEELAPDVLIVDLLWVTLRSCLSELACKKIFLCRQVSSDFLALTTRDGTLRFDPTAYDRVLATEPWRCPITDRHIEPIVIRNRDEILPEPVARNKLGLAPETKYCLFSLNSEEAEAAAAISAAAGAATDCALLENEGWKMFRSTLFGNGIFPIADYYNAFGKVISGAGYNAFWEARYFKKDAIFLPQKRMFEDQAWRARECGAYEFSINGADQLADLIAGF